MYPGADEGNDLRAWRVAGIRRVPEQTGLRYEHGTMITSAVPVKPAVAVPGPLARRAAVSWRRDTLPGLYAMSGLSRRKIPHDDIMKEISIDLYEKTQVSAPKRIREYSVPICLYNITNNRNYMGSLKVRAREL